ncbi:1,4-alpha-glucan branching enzyme [bacterium BMS3Abin07]|nr:1,4-alpha-glucan branching enzyme [bacterium BMS3Abin07]GBE32269.1 1,4-alpha-glucan branching enzyme [bacterium BMS3Bbin05]HDO22820.1 DUF1957 domain-containing protein [Nitrospirota bacterium]HDZ88744.1 DUF1957 domain-containing protein [Nitrospirota bacterium]
MASSGNLILVLHAHLPYIKHPRNPNHIEQRWFFEAVADSYLPLIDTLYKLHEKGTEYHITVSLSPTLCVMLNDDELKNGCELYLNNLIEFAGYECFRNRQRPGILRLSKRYVKKSKELLGLYTDKYRRDLISPLKQLRDEGRVTLITSAATHAFLPLLDDYPQALHAQITGGINIFSGITGIRPDGFWLPECGYSPEVERALDISGVSYTAVESHGLIFSRPFPHAGIYRPVVGSSGVMLFGRDSEVSRLVWSAESGYPADAEYRDFYEDAVSELSDEEVKRFINPDGFRVPSGIRYRKITGKEKKEIYEPRKAALKLNVHAMHFIKEVREIMVRARQVLGVAPVVTAAFDAELFGHWWYEGCGWLERVLAGISGNNQFTMGKCNHFVDSRDKFEQVIPESSSWGYGGYSQTWINPRNDWIIRYIHNATGMFIKLAEKHMNVRNRKVAEAMNVAAREILMLQTSDWGFMLNTNVSADYVKNRFLNHYERAMNIIKMIESGMIEEAFLKEIISQDGEFTETDFRWFCGD